MKVLLRRLDTADNRAFWKFVEDTAAYVRTHVLCFSNHCVVGIGKCPKAAPPDHAPRVERTKDQDQDFARGHTTEIPEG